MDCPKCNGVTAVIDTRGNWRRRSCKSAACGHRFYTTEIIVSERPDAKPKKAKIKPREKLLINVMSSEGETVPKTVSENAIVRAAKARRALEERRMSEVAPYSEHSRRFGIR